MGRRDTELGACGWWYHTQKEACGGGDGEMGAASRDPGTCSGVMEVGRLCVSPRQSLCLPVCLSLHLYGLTCLNEINAKAHLKKNFFFTVLGVEPRALGTLGMCSTTQPRVAFLVLNKVLLHRPDWPWMYSLAQAGLELSVFLSSAAEKAVLHSQAWQDLSLNLVDFFIY